MEASKVVLSLNIIFPRIHAPRMAYYQLLEMLEMK